jgi:hypothetical protein
LACNSEPTLLPSPPVFRGRGVRGEGAEPCKGCPPSPRPSPPEYRGRGGDRGTTCQATLANTSETLTARADRAGKMLPSSAVLMPIRGPHHKA